MISVVIPFHNRIDLTCLAIRSLERWKAFKIIGEIIIVDDASIEETIKIKLEIQKISQILDVNYEFFHIEENLGATGAKNYGAYNSTCEWLLFLDSDDELLKVTKSEIEKLKIELKNNDLIFGRCLSQNTGSPIGHKSIDDKITIKKYINGRFDFECLPFVRRTTFLKNPYNTEMHGCEGLSYIAMLASGAKGYYISTIMRLYRDQGDDRLSSPKNLGERSKQILKYHFLTLKYYKFFSIRNILMKLVKIFIYMIIPGYLISKIRYRK